MSQNKADEGISVMVLHRPGCELLEKFLIDFVFILKSYGIDVKMALLDQNEVELDGGIASYMQHHISTCDYILVMCTDDEKETHHLYKHNVYKFALNVMSGRAFHENDGSRYIPIYLTPYRDIVKYLPSFLHASSTCGYQLPKDINKLIQRILKVEQITTTKEGLTKDFVDRMKKQSKNILEEHHSFCLKDHCVKGLAYESVTDLSSIWSSAVHSDCQSHSEEEEHPKS